MRKIVILLLLSSYGNISAQGILDLRLNVEGNGESLDHFLHELEEPYNSRFYFLPDWITGIQVNKSYKDVMLSEVLEDLFLGTDLTFISIYPNSVVIIRDPNQAMIRKNLLEQAYLQKKKIEQFVFGQIGNAKTEFISISGQLIDEKTKEPLLGVNITWDKGENGTSTDGSGNYMIKLPPGIHVVSFSYVDYEDIVVDLSAYRDGEINLEMKTQPILLDEIVIQDKAYKEITTSRIGQIRLTIQDIKKSPAFMGEVDLVKQVQLLPGVSNVGEASSGFNVRGGSVDQNLILYDGHPVFNSSHVFGFLTSFNPEAVRDVSFFRGGIPAEFGGRASSVLDIKSKDGDLNKWNFSGGLGLITSNLMANGPIEKEKTAIALSVRSTYSDWLINSIRTDYADLRNSSLRFYDGTLKATHLLSEKTKISLTGYSSSDAFRLFADTTYRWRNSLGSVRVDHRYSERLNAEFIIGTSSYGYNILNNDSLTSSDLSFRITSTSAKAGFHYGIADHKLNFGWHLIHYNFNPGTLKPTTASSNTKSVSLNRQNAIENAFYIADELTLTSRVTADLGVRLPVFVSLGPAMVKRYSENGPRELSTIVDTLTFGKGNVIKAYAGIEPRASLRWMTSKTSSIKLGYNRIHQYLHLVTNSTAVTPIDIWQPSGYYFKPQRADQISVGYFKELKESAYSMSGEVFYKWLTNILDFKDGAQLILNQHIETDLLQGKGFSYGFETSVAKNTGRLTATLNYTYSRSFRTIDGPTTTESINRGKQYPTNFDQPHILNFSWKYNLSRRHFFTGNFTFHSGRPVTIPVSALVFENTTVAYFSERNQYRIPDYHRLDLALVIEGSHKKYRRVKGSWVLSVYNVYGRNNPYTIFFKSNGSGIPEPYQLSIVGTVFPSVSYNFKIE